MTKLQRQNKPTSFEAKKKISVMTEMDMEERRYVELSYSAIMFQRKPTNPECPDNSEN